MIILDYFEHISLGIFLGFGLDYLLLDLTIIETMLYYLFIGFGCMLPDIDTPESKLGKLLGPLSALLNITVGHRTFTHSILVITVLFYTSFVFWDMNIIITGLMLGCIFHILGDLLTPSGVALIYPISKKRFKIPQ